VRKTHGLAEEFRRLCFLSGRLAFFQVSSRPVAVWDCKGRTTFGTGKQWLTK